MFLHGLEKIAGFGSAALNAVKKTVMGDAGRKMALRGAAHGAIGGAAAGAITNKDENGNAAPLSGAIKGALGGAVAGGAAGAAHGAVNRSRLASLYKNRAPMAPRDQFKAMRSVAKGTGAPGAAREMGKTLSNQYLSNM